MKYPLMFSMCQRFITNPVKDIPGKVRVEMAGLKLHQRVRMGQSVAVTAGSRGIANMQAILAAIVSELKALGAKPFVVPAMGSHGGATSRGQKEVLRRYGITQEGVGAPIKSSMDVVRIGETPDGLPVFMDRHAFQADHIVVFNRVKPHTEFKASVESGLMKMLAIGLGKQKGADLYHGAIIEHGYPKVILSVAGEILKRCPVLFGLAVVENQRDETEVIRAVASPRIPMEEKRLLTVAKKLLPRIPLNRIDLLIVDRMGKDVSGVGMDPNVLERSANPTTNYFSKGSAQKIRHVFVRDLTDGTHGNALGLGNAEFTTRRLIDKMDLQSTYMNCITANDPWSGRIPLYFDNDRQAMEAALKTIGNVAPSDARIVHISDTSYLEKMEISEAMVEDAMGHENVEIHQRGRAMRFDRKGNLISRFAKT